MALADEVDAMRLFREVVEAAPQLLLVLSADVRCAVLYANAAAAGALGVACAGILGRWVGGWVGGWFGCVRGVVGALLIGRGGPDRAKDTTMPPMSRHDKQARLLLLPSPPPPPPHQTPPHSSFWDFVHPSDQPPLLAAVSHAILTQESPDRRLPCRLRRRRSSTSSSGSGSNDGSDGDYAPYSLGLTFGTQGLVCTLWEGDGEGEGEGPEGRAAQRRRLEEGYFTYPTAAPAAFAGARPRRRGGN
jgi:hypothetical protein